MLPSRKEGHNSYSHKVYAFIRQDSCQDPVFRLDERTEIKFKVCSGINSEEITNYEEQHHEMWKPFDLLKIQLNRY